MKILKIALLAGAVLVFTPSFSQNVTKKVTKEICTCFNKIDLKSPVEALRAESEACLVQGMMNNIDRLVKKYKIKEDDAEATNKMAEDIVKRLLEKCPSAVSIFMIIGGSEEKPADN